MHCRQVPSDQSMNIYCLCVYLICCNTSLNQPRALIIIPTLHSAVPGLSAHTVQCSNYWGGRPPAPSVELPVTRRRLDQMRIILKSSKAHFSSNSLKEFRPPAKSDVPLAAKWEVLDLKSLLTLAPFLRTTPYLFCTEVQNSDLKIFQR